MMWPRLAPSARRMPISRVRSVTLASMMFMMPIPPTNSEIAAIKPMNTMNINRVARACSKSSNGTTRAQSSFSCRARSVLRITSAVGTTSSGRAT